MAVCLSGPPVLPAFDAVGEPATLAPRWKTWKAEFELYVVASGVTDPTQQRALLLHLAGPAVRDIFKTFADEDKGGAKDYNKAIDCLSDYFKVKKNVPMARQTFLAAKPNPGETINNFASRLKSLVEHCDYGEEEDNQVRDHVISHIKNKNLKAKLYREETLTLSKLLEIVSQYHDKEALILIPEGHVNRIKGVMTRQNLRDDAGSVTRLVTSVRTAVSPATTSVKNVVSWVTSKPAAVANKPRVLARARLRAMVVNAVEERAMSEEEGVHEHLATYAKSPRT